MFGVQRLTEQVRLRIGEALEEAGLIADPPLATVERYGTVRLTLRAEAGTVGPALGGRERADGDLIVQQLAGVVWMDVDATVVDEVAALHRALSAQVGPALTLPLVERLLERDPLPFVAALDDNISNVSAFRVAVVERPGSVTDAGASKAEAVVFSAVEFLQGPGWIITAWQEPEAIGGPGDETLGAAYENPRADTRAAVLRNWRARPGDGSGDLGLTILAELAQSYTAVRRELYGWHEQWEVDFDQRQHLVETNTLVALRRMSLAFRRRLVALNRPGMSRHPDLVWFADGDPVIAGEIDDVIDRALASLQSLRDNLRTSTEMITTVSSIHQDRQSEQFQRLVTVAGAVLLVPTLVAGVYGANTRLPGRDTWVGFVVMLIAMVLSAILTFAALNRWRAHESARAEGRRGSETGPSRGG